MHNLYIRIDRRKPWQVVLAGLWLCLLTAGNVLAQLPTCGPNQITSGYAVGATAVVSTTGAVTSATAALGAGDGSTATLNANSGLTLDMGTVLPAGSRLTLSYAPADTKAPLQVLVASTAAGPFTNIAQLSGSTYVVTLPIAMRYLQLVTTGTVYYLDAITYPIYTCVNNPIPSCAVGQTLMTYPVGTQSVNTITGTVSNSANAAGPPDRTMAVISPDGSITLDFGSVVAGGNVLSLAYSSQYTPTYALPLKLLVSTTGTPGSFTAIGLFQPTLNTSISNGSLTLPIDARYVQLVAPAGTYSTYYVDALTYSAYSCVSPPNTACLSGQISVTSLSGAQATGTTSGTVTSTTNVLGISDGKVASLSMNSSLSIDMGSVMAAGITLTFSYSSADNASPLQVWTSNNAGGGDTYIGSVPVSMNGTTRQLTLPLAAQYIKLVTTGTGYSVDAVTQTVYSCVADPAACAVGQQSIAYWAGGGTSVYSTSGTVSNPGSATGVVNGAFATLSPDATVTLDLGSTIAAGNVLALTSYSQSNSPNATPMQVLVATDAGGPYTSLGNIQPNTSVNTANLPLQTNARYVRLITPSTIYSTYNVDAVMYQAYACVSPVSIGCSAGQQSLSYEAGVQGVGSTTGTVTSTTNIVGVSDGMVVSVGANSSFIADMGNTLPAGTVLKVYYSSVNTTAPMQVWTSASASGPFTFIGTVTSSTSITSQALTLPVTAQYIQLKTAGTAYSPDAITYSVYTCAAPPTATCPAGQKLVSYSQGAAGVNATTGTVSNTANASGLPDGNTASLNANASITLDMGSSITAGNSLMVTYKSTDTNAPLQVLVATNAIGPYTNIAQLPGNTSRTTQSVQLPLATRYVKLLTTGTAYSVDAVAYPIFSCVTPPSTTCTSGQFLASYTTGAQGFGATTGSVTSATYATGTPDGNLAVLDVNSSLILNLGSVVTAGNTLNITYQSGNTTAPMQVLVSTNAGDSYTNIIQLAGTTTSKTVNLVLPVDAQYVQLQTTATNYWVDAVTQTLYNCVIRPVTSCSAGQVSSSYQVGLSAGNANIVGVPDGNAAYIDVNSSSTADLGSALPAGTTIYVTYSSADLTAPMQVLVATSTSGPYINIAQLGVRTNWATIPITLPVSARYIRLQTTATAYSVDAITYPVYTCVSNPASNCSVGQQLVSYVSGAQSVTSGVTDSANALGRPDGAVASMPTNSLVLLDLGAVVTGGNSLQVTSFSYDLKAPLQVLVATNYGGPYTNIAQLTAHTGSITQTVDLPVDARYVKLQTTNTGYGLDAVTYLVNTCVNTPALSCAVGQQTISSYTGATSISSATNVTSPGSATGMSDGTFAATTYNTNSTLTLDLGTVVAGGNALNVRYYTAAVTTQMQVLIATNAGGPYINIGQLPIAGAGKTASFTLPMDTRYVQLQSTNSQYYVDAVTYSVYTCISSSLTSGVVYLDADVNGILNGAEQGLGGVTVKAYDASGNLVGTTTTSDANPVLAIPAGYYGFTNLTAGQPYRLEFSNWPSQYSSSGYGADNSTSVQFIQGVTANNDLGLYLPSSVCSLSPNSRMVYGTGLTQYTYGVSVGSWNYLDRSSGSSPLVSTEDISYTTVGIPIGLASQRPRNWVYMSPLSTDFTGLFPLAPDGSSAIYIANYNAPDGSQSYQGTKLLVKLSDLGIDVGPTTKTVGAGTFGVQGLGGLDFTPSGDTMFVVNMYHGSLVGVDVSRVDYATLPASKPTAAFEIYPPASLAGCSGGVYRPTALKQYGGKLYVGGVCDAEISTKVADLQGVVLAYDPTTGTWSKTFSFPFNFTGGGIYGETGHGPVDWSSSLSTEVAPVLFDLAFADNGQMVMGITDRFIYTYSSNNQVGYVIGAWKNADGSYKLENAGKLGPFTSSANNVAINPDGSNSAVNDGPGSQFFFQQKNFDGRPYGYSGGLYIKSGTNYVLAGYLDARSGYSNGAVYLNLSTGAADYGSTLVPTGTKVARITSLDQVCDAIPPIEIGNRVWKDTNNNGIQDADEPPLAGVTVELRDAGGNLVATAITNAGGNYSFSNLPNLSNTSAQKYNLPLTPLTNYSLRISSLGSDTSTTGLTLAGISPAPSETAGAINTGSTTINNDAFLVGGFPSISLKTGVDGMSAHTYDFGFVDVPCSLSLTVTPGTCDPATNQYTVTGIISLTAAPASSLTLADGLVSTIVSVTAGQSAATYSLSGLSAGTDVHTVTILSSATTCATTSVTYTAPLSCSIAPALALSVTPGVCSTATNQYSISGTISLTAAVAGSLTITDGISTITVSVTAGQTTASFALTGLPSGTGSHTVTVSGIGYSPASATYTAPEACTIAVDLTVTPGTCQSATNQYSLSGILSLTNAIAGTATITDGVSSISVSVNAGDTSVPYSLSGLNSGTGVHMVTVSYASQTASVTYTAPASCTVAPCGLAMLVTPGLCESATNTYTLSGTITATNVPSSGTLTISSEAFSDRTIALPIGNASGAFSYSGLVSNGQVYTITASYSDGACAPVSQTYTAPASCSVAPVCSLSATATAGLCASATNTYSATVVVSLTNATAGTLTINVPGAAPISQTIAATTPTFTGIFQNLLSDGAIHTATISLPGCGTTTANFTAPVSCSVAPVCSISAGASVGPCDIATNTYSVTALVTVQNPVAGGTVSVGTGGQTFTFSTTAVSQNTFAATFNGLISDGASHVILVSLPDCGTTTATYTAPTSCSAAPVCSLSAITSTGQCATATNTFSNTVTITLTNPMASTLTVTDGVHSVTFAVPNTTGTVTAPAIFNGLVSDGASHTVTIGLPGCGTTTATYTAPASCSVAPDLALLITPGSCNAVTNQYTASGTISLTAAVASTLTITDGTSTTTIAITNGQTTASFLLAGLNSGTGSHTVTVSGTNYSTTSVTYTAPASCSVAPVCALSLVVTPGVCNSATNQYTTTGMLTAANTTGSQQVTVTDGVISTTVALTGNGPTSFTLTGLASDGALHTVVASATACGQVSTTYTAPASCSVSALVVVTSATVCYGSSATLVASGCAGTVSWNTGTLGNTLVIPGLTTLTNYTATCTVANASTTAIGTVTVMPQANLSLQASNTLVTVGSSVSLSAVGCSGNLIWNTNATSPVISVTPVAASQTYSATCTTGPGCTATASVMIQTSTPIEQPKLDLTKRVDKSIAQIGDILTYTLVLTNTGTVEAINTVVRDSSGIGLKYIANSATAPVGTTFTPGSPVSSWHIPTLSVGQSLSLSFQARADSTGILFNTSTIPGDTAKVCTSIPVHMCVGDVYTFELTAQAGRSSYKWYRDGVEIVGSVTNVLNVTATGTYSVVVDGATGQCPDFSCCPFIVQEDSLPTFKAVPVPVSCVGNTPQANGQIILSRFKAGFTYQYSLGATFNEAASISGAPQAIPTNGVIVNNLVNPATAQSYTVRVYNTNGCYQDVTVLLMPTVCGCPADVCVPFVITQTKRAKRIGDPR